MSFRDGENSDLTSENMEQEVKINIEETSINLGYVKKELENEEFQENQYKIAWNLKKSETNSEDSFKEENKDLIQETIEQSHLETIQCNCCKILFEEWAHLEDHMQHCLDEKYNRFKDDKLGIQRKPADQIEGTLRNGEILTAIDDNKSCITIAETIDSKYADKISKTCKEGSFSEKKHKCSECSYQSNHKRCLKLHVLNQHSNTSKKDVKAVECDICKKRFTAKSSLKTHIRDQHSNTNEKAYKCTECSYQSNHKRFLKLHVLSRHSNATEENIKPFECDICKMRFNRKDVLKRHTVNIHSNTNENYKCSKCSYQTIYKRNLKAHFNMHYKIKPFECDICKKRFTRKDSLKIHIRDLHSNTNEKEYKCTECSYQSNHNRCLKLHVLNQHSNTSKNGIKPFECDICKNRFTQMCRLKQHVMNIHSNTNEKIYKCSECSYQTIYKRNLKPHLNIHNKIKPFECDICKKRFARKGILKTHVIFIHSNTDYLVKS